MDLFSIIIMTADQERVQSLYQALELELRKVHKQTIVQLDVDTFQAHSVLSCKGILPAFQLHKHGKAIYKKTAAMLTNYIIEMEEKNIVHFLMEKHYESFNAEEISSIEHFCQTLLDNENIDHPHYHTLKNRKIKITQELTDYMSKNTELNLNGLIKFRFTSYMKDLREILDYAVDEYIMDKQYKEFITLLKYFVFVQESKIPVAHLFHQGGNDFIMLDEQMMTIDMKQMEVIIEGLDHEVHFEDMIVSTLITIAPQKIYIHTRNPEEQVLNTIKQIFDDRVYLCTYCEACKSIIDEKDVKKIGKKISYSLDF